MNTKVNILRIFQKYLHWEHTTGATNFSLFISFSGIRIEIRGQYTYSANSVSKPSYDCPCKVLFSYFRLLSVLLSSEVYLNITECIIVLLDRAHQFWDKTNWTTKPIICWSLLSPVVKDFKFVFKTPCSLRLKHSIFYLNFSIKLWPVSFQTNL